MNAIAAAEGGILTIMVAGGTPIRDGFIRCLDATNAATTGTANVAAGGVEAGIIAVACAITAVGPDTRM